MLDLIGISKTFNPGTINEKKALSDLSLHLDDGEFVTVIGGNGAGKSTMLNAVAGVWPVDSGQILLGGEDITAWPEHKRAVHIGRVFQDPMMGTAPNMQLEENLALALRRGQKRGLKWGVTKLEREDYRALLADLGLGLEDRLTVKVSQAQGQGISTTVTRTPVKSSRIYNMAGQSVKTAKGIVVRDGKKVVLK